MQQPLQIVFKDVPPSQALDADIRKRAEKLQRICHEMISCRVTVGPDGKHKHQGNLYKARVDISVPGSEIVADSRPMHEDVYISIHDAFDAATRQLEEYVQRRR
ncbi:MAG TPA: HPF/RaiA family ribosome-associated protein [Burkholderiaceae bacterium]|jgi:ribosomal subunit interface protein|nr:HPF/RaiA family ribosome-associated protein [Burkholderiaceae bacterium]